MAPIQKRWWIFLAIVVLIALRIYFWGLPVPVKYRIVSQGTGTPSILESQFGPAQRITASDTDGDGTWDRFTSVGGVFNRPDAQHPPRRWLVVCLDGVPLSEMQSLWDRGHFREMYRPTATVSTLPSDTETALTEALHAAPVPGYEHLYFDRAANRMRGGAWVTFSGYRIPYIRELDYDPPGWAKAVPYIVTRKTYRADIGRLRRRFLASTAPVFIAHVASSDALLHVTPLPEAEPLLVEFEDVIRELYLDGRGDVGVLLFSDHGDTETPSVLVPLPEFLRQKGWRLRSSLQRPNDVVIPAYGLVGFAALYTRPDKIEGLAESFRGLEGADLIVSRHLDGQGATIRSAGSSAIADLSWSPDGGRYLYSARDGDPLALLPVFERLRAAGKLDAGGFAGDADLFAATSLAENPDAAARIREWVIDHVRNRADVFVCFRPGYDYGSAGFQRIVSLAGTHGGLDRASSLGFAMATYPLPAATRLSDLLSSYLHR